MPTDMYAALYYITAFIHYAGTAALLYWIVVKKLKLSLSWMCLVWFVAWFSAGVLCNGCPFTYAEEYFAYKAWGTERTYDFTKSLLYQLFLRYF